MYLGVCETKYTWWHFKSNIIHKYAFYNPVDCLTETGIRVYKADAAMKLLKETKLIDLNKTNHPYPQ